MLGISQLLRLRAPGWGRAVVPAALQLIAPQLHPGAAVHLKPQSLGAGGPASYHRGTAASTGAINLEAPCLLPRVALLGRPNVGKSALFNRLVRRKAALVFDTPESHVTRDWREDTARLADLVFRLVDTAGLESSLPPNTIQARTSSITARMLQSAHLALMVIDARAGILGPDEALAQWLHRHFNREHVFLVANKADGAAARSALEQTVADSFRLGFGEPVAVSATTGEGLSDLYNVLQPWIDKTRANLLREAGVDPSTVTPSKRPKQHHLLLASSVVSTGEPMGTEEQQQDGQEAFHEAVTSRSSTSTAIELDNSQSANAIKMVIMGLPNAGKSTLVNQLIGEERVLTGPEPGLTRDTVSILCERHGWRYELLDTAGYVGQTKVDKYDDVGGDIAGMARSASLRTLAAAQVVVLVVDAAAALQSQRVLSPKELGLIAHVSGEGKGLVVVANKMDAVDPSNRKVYLETLRTTLKETFRTAGEPEVIGMSAQSGWGVHKLFPAVSTVYNAWNARVSTGQLNALVRRLYSHTQGSGGASVQLGRIKYITQVKTRPPTFACFLTGSVPVDMSFERYLGNTIRTATGLQGTPLRFWFRYKTRRAVWKKKLELPDGQQKTHSKAAAWLEGKPVQAPWVFMQQRARVAASESGGLLQLPAEEISSPATPMQDLSAQLRDPHAADERHRLRLLRRERPSQALMLRKAQML